MLARHMRHAQLVELALYAALSFWLHRRGWSIAACAAAIPALFLGTRFAAVCTMYALAWLHRTRRAGDERIGLPAGIAMFLREYAAFLALSLVRTPWAPWIMRPDPPGDAPGELPIVLVHGYFVNRGCWKPFVQALEAAGLGPVFVPDCRSHLCPIAASEEDLHAAIERVSRGRRVALVTHSMGGLVARLYLARRGPDRVARLVTIGSPHHGTRLAAWGIGPNAREMLPGSPFLAALEASEAAAARPPTLCIYSLHDDMVTPQESARLPWARNVSLRGYGHVTQFGAPEVVRLVVEELRGGR